MKKYFSIVLILIISSLLFGCGAQTSQPEGAQTQPSSKAVSKKVSKPKAYKGIDVSSFNGEIDWKAVKKDGRDFAMIRLGGRGFGADGQLYKDRLALRNLTLAKKHGLKTGAYFFSQALTKQEAAEEAAFALSVLGDIELDLPLAYDLETLEDTETRVENISESAALANAKVFCEKIERKGLKSAVYIEKDGILKASDFRQNQIWYSDFGSSKRTDCLILQYSKEGRVRGVDGKVDLDVMYK
ncbi:MAG: hypothetical protein IIU14_03700 [Ruminococcus sp.]|nr:hypothetical protein [Ruminococcus sp.]